MILSDIVKLAEAITREAHAGQTDRGGKPYILHIEQVVGNLLRRWPDATEDEIIAAWLHDILEDTDWTAERLIMAGIPPEAVSIVEEVSRPREDDGGTRMTYRQWITALARDGSYSAVKVKIADNESNSDPERVAAIPEGSDMLRKRYQPARVILENRINSGG